MFSTEINKNKKLLRVLCFSESKENLCLKKISFKVDIDEIAKR